MVNMLRLQTHEEELTVSEQSKGNPAEIEAADSKSCTGSFFQGI